MFKGLVKYGLKAARFEFTDIIDAARNGEEVAIVEIGNDRLSKRGYIVRKMTDEELKNVPKRVKPESLPLPPPLPLP